VLALGWLDAAFFGAVEHAANKVTINTETIEPAVNFFNILSLLMIIFLFLLDIARLA
jgi:hypothetical protein